MWEERVKGRRLTEVSCRNTVPIIHWLRLEGLPVDRTLADIGFDIARLEDASSEISWDDFGRFLAAFEPSLSDEDFRRMGRDLLDSPALRVIGVVASNAASIGWLTRWVLRLTCGPRGLLYRGVEYELRTASPERLTVVLRANSGRRLPRGMALAFAGSLEGMAALLGAEKASVAVRWTPQRFELDLRAESPRGFAVRLRRALRRIRSDNSSVEVQAAYEDLMLVKIELERQLDALRESEAKREELERRLRQSQKMEAIGRFSGAIAHDFNNLLTVLCAHAEFAELALEDGLSPESDIRAISEVVDRATSLTRQLLAFGRQQEMDFRALSLNQVVGSLSSMLSTLVGERVTIELQLGDDVPDVAADRTQLEQVLANLCANARDAMPRGGRVRIETREEYLDEAFVAEHPGANTGNHVLLSVSDDGEGMTPEVRERVFEPFFTTKPEGRGTGLGLATVYGIVRQSGGFLWLYSEPGEGTTFKIFLPCHDPDAAPAPPAHEAQPSPGPDQAPGRVLVVEDDPKVRSATVRALEGAGHQVWVAEHGEEGLRIFDAHADSVELVVSDIVMPGMAGEELARRLRERSESVGVLMMSGYADDGLVRGRIANADRFLQKPFAPASLLRAVHELLATVRVRRSPP